MPDFCKNSTILILLLIVALASTIVHLLTNDTFDWMAFSLVAVYLLWIVLGSAALLCIIGRKLSSVSSGWRIGLSVLMCFLVFLAVELVTQVFYLQNWDSSRFLRFNIIAVLVLAVVFRFFSLLQVAKHRAQLEISTRLQALQARIEPHFLFNSLNTIAELAHLDADQADRAIQSLSALLRTSISDDQPLHTVSQELALCEEYLELEKWRLGERLRVQWDIDLPDDGEAVVPKLLLQPLIENAVVHGVAQSSDGGQVDVSLQQSGQKLHVVIENTLADDDMSEYSEQSIIVDTDNNDMTSQEGGFGIAIDNIKERLFVVYDDQYRFTTSKKKGRFKVSIDLPAKPAHA